MPTKKKRVGFIPREDVMKIIVKLSIENNLSNSKIISILVEEALSIRGMFNKKSGKENEFYNNNSDLTEYLIVDSDKKDNDKFKLNSKSDNYKRSSNNHSVVKTIHNEFDIQTYKKFLSFLKFQEMMEDYNS